MTDSLEQSKQNMEEKHKRPFYYAYHLHPSKTDLEQELSTLWAKYDRQTKQSDTRRSKTRNAIVHCVRALASRGREVIRFNNGTDGESVTNIWNNICYDVPAPNA